MDALVSAFASYSSEDRESVNEAANLLRSSGIDLFIDQLSLRGGDRWQERIADAIRDAQVFYLFWSQFAAMSSWVDWEWHQAIERVTASGKVERINL